LINGDRVSFASLNGFQGEFVLPAIVPALAPLVDIFANNFNILFRQPILQSLALNVDRRVLLVATHPQIENDALAAGVPPFRISNHREGS
jgi:hypothetical protein